MIDVETQGSKCLSKCVLVGSIWLIVVLVDIKSEQHMKVGNENGLSRISGNAPLIEEPSL